MLERKLAALNEQSLFQLLKDRLIPDLQLNDQFHFSDCFSKEKDLIVELKCRRFHYETLIIEQSKYIKLMSASYWEVRYINSTPIGIYSFDLRMIEEPTWITKDCKRTTDFEDNSYVPKLVGMLELSEAKDITKLLLE
jgi:hypothetical protein